MPVRAPVALPMTRPVSSTLTINQITQEAVRLWKNSNAFLQYMDKAILTAPTPAYLRPLTGPLLLSGM
jgi:hypothetical protein